MAPDARVCCRAEVRQAAVDDVAVEVHDDLYGLQPGRWRLALDQLGSLGLLEEIDEERLHAADQVTDLGAPPVGDRLERASLGLAGNEGEVRAELG